jgi:hypothetical protein
VTYDLDNGSPHLTRLAPDVVKQYKPLPKQPAQPQTIQYDWQAQQQTQKPSWGRSDE